MKQSVFEYSSGLMRKIGLNWKSANPFYFPYLSIFSCCLLYVLMYMLDKIGVWPRPGIDFCKRGKSTASSHAIIVSCCSSTLVITD